MPLPDCGVYSLSCLLGCGITVTTGSVEGYS
jgi:hypothetical protein